MAGEWTPRGSFIGPTPDIEATVSSLAPGAAPEVIRSGTPERPVLDFRIPRGDTGPASVVEGPRGPAGYSATGAAEDQQAIAEYIRAAAGDNPVWESLKSSVVIPQADYVEMLGARSRTSRLQLEKTADGFQVSCITSDGTAHVTYQFPTPTDDYWVAGEVWVGGIGPGVVSERGWASLATSGSYQTDTTVYTTQVGASFDCQVTVPSSGGSVLLNHYTDTRGGVWHLTLGELEMSVSTHNAGGPNGVFTKTGFQDVPGGTYTLHGEFLGEDPEHAPTATARGWLGSTDGSRPTVIVQAPTLSMDTLLAPKSNRDFALDLAPASGGDPEFVPYHGYPTGVAAEPAAIYDGAKIIDLAGMAVGELQSVSSFEIVQHIYGRNSGSGTANLIEVWTSHRIHPDARLSITGRWKALQEISLNRGYVIMGPVTGDLFDRMVTSTGHEYANSEDLYGTSTTLTAESDVAQSFCFLSSSKPDVGMAFRYNNAAETIRRGLDGKRPEEDRSFLEHRNERFLKHYQTLYANGAIIPAGTVHRFSGDYIHVAAPAIMGMLALS